MVAVFFFTLKTPRIHCVDSKSVRGFEVSFENVFTKAIFYNTYQRLPAASTFLHLPYQNNFLSLSLPLYLYINCLITQSDTPEKVLYL